jgi:hypothetical protein
MSESLEKEFYGRVLNPSGKVGRGERIRIARPPVRPFPLVFNSVLQTKGLGPFPALLEPCRTLINLSGLEAVTTHALHTA